MDGGGPAALSTTIPFLPLPTFRSDRYDLSCFLWNLLHRHLLHLIDAVMPTLASTQTKSTDLAITGSHPTYFIGHAGVGLLFREGFETVQDNLRDIGREILALQPRPKGIIALSGHFEAGEIHGPKTIEGTPYRARCLLKIWPDACMLSQCEETNTESCMLYLASNVVGCSLTSILINPARLRQRFSR